jgi:Ca-activated chloride channel family protein
VKDNVDFAKKADEENKEWEDYGYWFMFPSVFIMLFWFRKGWVVTWVFLIFSFPWYGCSADSEVDSQNHDFKFIDLWLTQEQQAQRLYDNGEFLKAADMYEDQYWKGVSYYRAKEFQLAVQVFYQLKTPQGYFNVGMCMAELENWDEALFAFEEALKMSPEFEEAKHNIAEVKKLIPPDKEIELVTPQSFEDKFLSRSEEIDQESDEEGDKEEKEGGEKSEEEQVADLMQQGNQQVIFPDDAPQEQQEQDQKDILLKQMSDDPAVFLKRKFSMQYKKAKNQVSISEKKW